MAEPLISVVTPSFNQADFIEDNLTSVARQEHAAIEHIVIDGGSADGTVDILRQYEDSYNLKWSSEADEGQSHAINKGFDRSNGDIIGWLNSDDVYFDRNVFDRVVDHFRRTGADVIYGDLVTIDERSQVIGVDLRPDFSYRQLLVRTLIGQPAVFFDSSVLTDERLDTSKEYTMDYEFWLRLARDHEFRHVRDILAGFRRHRNQKTESQEPMRQEALETARSAEVSPLDARLLLELAAAESGRFLRSIAACVRLRTAPPSLAFEGQIASLPRLMRSVVPTSDDIRKFLERR